MTVVVYEIAFVACVLLIGVLIGYLIGCARTEARIFHRLYPSSNEMSTARAISQHERNRQVLR